MRIAITHTGMISPVGTSALQTTTSVLAGVSRLRATSLLDERWQPIRLGLLREPSLPPLAPALQARGDLSTRCARMIRLAGSALAECAEQAGALADVPMFLAIPEIAPGRASSPDARFFDDLAHQSGVGFTAAESTAFPLGRAAGFHALAAGLAAIEAGAPRALVGGVDSYLDPLLLGWLDAEQRLLAEGRPVGFMPGEGAAFVVLARAAGGVTLDAVGLGAEPGHRGSEEPFAGEGLTAAFRATLPDGADVQTVFAGMNGEPIDARAWGIAARRHHRALRPDAALYHPVENTGDPGAALGVMMVAMAATGLSRRRVRGPCLLWACSDGAPCGAARISMV
ncbi:MAG: hypothetical protein IPF99_34865 [Deltaproteobacteria bacterium]|nr:hypothetical protein [Deltaproteobacteria bacterium]